MKIAMLLFPNSRMGGIYTVHRHLKQGLLHLGHHVTDFYLSDNKSRPTVPAGESKLRRWIYCEGRVLGMMFPFVTDAISTLRKFDIIIYSTPAPSLNRSFDDRSWMLLFSKLHGHCRQIVMWHDPFWEKYYPWVGEIFEYIDLAAAIQEKAYDTIPGGIRKRAIICGHPLSLIGLSENTNAKRNLVISPHQFKSWKRIDLLVRAVPRICSAGYSVDVYNIGIEYYFMAGSLEKRKPKYKDRTGWIWDVAENAGMKYKGTVPFPEIDQAFREQKCVADLSVGELGAKMGKQYRSINYAPLECMKSGGIPVCRMYSVLPPFTEESFLLVDESDLVSSTAEQCIRAIRDWGTLPMRKLRAANRDVLRQKYDAKIVASLILDSV